MTTPLIGLWSLTEFVIQSKSARHLKRPCGNNPHGYMSYHSSGHMQALLCHEQRSPFPKDLEHAHAASAEDKAQAFNESLSYAGEWTLKDQEVLIMCNFSNPRRPGVDRTDQSAQQRPTGSQYDVSSRSGPISILKWQRSEGVFVTAIDYFNSTKTC